MAMANDLRALGEDINSGLLAPTQAWLDRFGRRVESVCRQNRRNGARDDTEKERQLLTPAEAETKPGHALTHADHCP